MQSSTTVMFRALVMLACLVAIPLAAVVGKSLPDMVKALLDGRWPGSSASAYGSLDEAPRFQASGFQASGADGSPAVSAAPTSVGGQPPLGQQAPLWSGAPVVATGREASVAPAFGSGISTWPSDVASGAGFGAAAPSASRVGTARAGPAEIGSDRRAPSMPGPHEVGPATPAAATVAQPGPMGDPFTQIQTRLRRIGATYYLLESWGSREQLYRFYCKVAVGGNPNYTHYFEATGSDPLAAMADVLGQIEAWRAGRR